MALESSNLRRPRARRRPVAEINVVPYIDVMLVLLVIFMVTAPLLDQGLELALPQAEGDPLNADPQPIVLMVTREGDWILRDGERSVPVTPDTLVARVLVLRGSGPNRPVRIRGDANVAYGQVIEAMGRLSAAGIKRVGLSTVPPERP